MKIRDMDAEDVSILAWSTFGLSVLATIVVLLVLAIVSDHKVRGYYLAADNTSTNTCTWIASEGRTVCSSPTCVWADIAWSVDSKAYCTTDLAKAAEGVSNLNATVK